MVLSPGTMIFPRCGLTLADVERVAESTKIFTEAARRLGVSINQFHRQIGKFDLWHLFEKQGDLVCPKKRVTLDEIKRIAEVAASKREAARLLGVAESHFYKLTKGLDIQFRRSKPRRSKLSTQMIRSLAHQGYPRRDAAFLAGFSYSHFKDEVRRRGLSELFMSSGKASWVSRRGYAAGPFPAPIQLGRKGAA